MRLSTKTRYGVRAMFDLAFHCAESGAVQAKEIAKREDIPLRYLEQIFQDLKRAQLVDSKRGPHCGYFLKRGPEQIQLSEIIEAVQGPIADLIADISAETEGPKCSRHVTAELWRELTDHISGWFQGITLASLIERANELGIPRSGEAQPMYYI